MNCITVYLIDNGKKHRGSHRQTGHLVHYNIFKCLIINHYQAKFYFVCCDLNTIVASFNTYLSERKEREICLFDAESLKCVEYFGRKKQRVVLFKNCSNWEIRLVKERKEFFSYRDASHIFEYVYLLILLRINVTIFDRRTVNSNIIRFCYICFYL